MPSFNKNNSAVKRIMQEARELATDPCTDYSAAPLEDDIFEWHCTLRGSPGTEFEGGLYHFRILLPSEYPFRPPSIVMLTPNGRFELNTKICISFTNYHEEMWQPAWGVRTAIIGLQGFFPLKGQAAVGVGSIEYPPSERKRLAALSREWVCPRCKVTNLEMLPDPVAEPHPHETESAAQITLANPSPASETPKAVAFSRQSSESPFPEPDVTIHTVHPTAPPTRTQSTSSLNSLVRREEPTHIVHLAPSSRAAVTTSARAQKPPLLLDTAICVLLVLAFALICRRIF